MDSERTCPSARCEEGAILLGVVRRDGKIAYVTPQIEIGPEFVQEMRAGPSPESRFRFAGRCVEDRCTQWTGSRCGIIDMAIEAQDAGSVPSLDPRLPRCSIRPTCRWYAQVGPRACAVCPLVVTDARSGDRSASTEDASAEGPTALLQPLA